jgi:excisionase family DNA binding protein
LENTELLTADETADYLKISKGTVWQWCRGGRLPAVKMGRQWRIRRKDLEAMLDPGANNPVETSGLPGSVD